MANVIIHILPVISMLTKCMEQRLHTRVRVHSTMKGFEDVVVFG
jgi:hypothetical protein